MKKIYIYWKICCSQPKSDRTIFSSGGIITSYQENEILTTFGAELSREEYIRFNELLAKTGGALRLQKPQKYLTVGMLVFCAGMMMYDYIKFKEVDISLLLLAGVIAMAAVFSLWVIPSRLRKSAGTQYDERVMGGYDFNGMVRVYPDRVEKDTVEGTAVVLLQQSVYIETADMIVLMAPDKKSIVIPGRCLVPEDADILRRAVMNGMPLNQQRVSRPIVAAAPERLHKSVSEREEEDILQQISLRYTPEEFVSTVTQTSLRTYMRLMPIYSAVALMSGITFGILYHFLMGTIAFVGTMLILFLLNVVVNRSRASRAAKMMPENALSAMIHITKRGVLIRSGGQEICMAWQAIKRAFEQPDYVEFITDSQSIRIPKRCIEDMESLREIVDTYKPPQKS